MRGMIGERKRERGEKRGEEYYNWASSVRITGKKMGAGAGKLLADEVATGGESGFKRKRKRTEPWGFRLRGLFEATRGGEVASQGWGRRNGGKSSQK